ncbi:interferon-induced transmembrane protein 5-like [Protopterus annectens]|uniref:interferon-induced transmembrane protein 5-like n=1 Tax=Protopterus annectens TaxID=7888 RepID=UPI001CFBD3A7|nr:interferon-induced transmembrane protein 5-like [Protopterus annectens]
MDSSACPRSTDYIPLSASKQRDPSAVSPTVIHIGPPVLPPKDHILWSLCNTMYLNLCCLGFTALVYSVKSRDQKIAGNLDGARHYAAKAKCYNILATMWNILIPLVLIALIITGVIHLSKMLQESYNLFSYKNTDSSWNDIGK